MRKTLLSGCILILLISGTAAIGGDALGDARPETREISLEIASGQCGFSRGQLEDLLLALPGVEDVWSPGADEFLQLEYVVEQTSPEEIVTSLNSTVEGFTIRVAAPESEIAEASGGYRAELPEVASDAVAVVFPVTGMYGQGCEAAVEGAVARLPGVQKVTATAADDAAEVIYDPAAMAAETIVTTIRDLGYGAELPAVEGESSAE